MQPDPEDPICGVDGLITGYLTKVTGLDPVELPPSERSHQADVLEVGSDTYDVYVAARNVLGLGNAAEGSFSKFVISYMFYFL